MPTIKSQTISFDILQYALESILRKPGTSIVSVVPEVLEVTDISGLPAIGRQYRVKSYTIFYSVDTTGDTIGKDDWSNDSND